MIKKLFLFFTLCSIALLTAAQNTDSIARDTLFEKAPMGMVRFYFDDHYFLVDKDCEFKAIERVSAFLVDKNVFHGEFKDFDRSGKVILQGTHNQGSKEGLFTAHHPNGAVKWTCTFKGNEPTGDWKYFYPDSRPMLTVNYDSTRVTLTDFWDRRGKQEVQAGQGTYEFMMPFDFYNEFGYPYFVRKGKIRNGLPYGYWTTFLTDNKKARELFLEEVYNKTGALTEGYNLFTAREFLVPFSILPTNHFENAERMVYKTCSFDDYSGFIGYISDKFNSIKDIVSDLKNTEHPFTFRVSLDKEGMPTGINFNNKTKEEKLNQRITFMIKEIPYYFPSIDAEGNPIEDTLTISGILSIDPEGLVNFSHFTIERQKQP